MSFMDAREHGSKPGSGGAASAQNEVQSRVLPEKKDIALCARMLTGALKSPSGLSLHRFSLCPRAVCVHPQAIDRRERLRRLALETIDLTKDPYFMRNHLGQVCKVAREPKAVSPACSIVDQPAYLWQRQALLTRLCCSTSAGCV